MKHELDEINLFVAGRLCLLGEHSDWTFEYKNINKDLLPGYTIATAIDKGIYATVKKDENFVFQMGDKFFSCALQEDVLYAEAISGSFYSYMAGTALYMLRKYKINGIYVEVKYNTLPIKKGLSSSAAICSLIAKAFSQLYELNLNRDLIMESAYQGERLAQSKCGKLDQICINGECLVKMTFYPENIDIEPIKVKSPLYMIIADLNATKDTKKILNALHTCYPFAENEKQQKVQDMLGYKNKELIEKVIKAIENDDQIELGNLLKQSQKLIDDSAIPICDEYKAPILHQVLHNTFIEKLSYGARGIGSGGDGSIQVLAKDALCQNLIVNYFQNKLCMDAFAYTIRPYYKVRKAIIPLAGLGNRMYPLTRAFRHAFLPIHDGKTMKPLILKLVEDLDSVGIEEICLVIGEHDYDVYNQFFKLSLNRRYLDSLDEDLRASEFNTLRLGEKIKYIVQEKPLGLGHAISLCRGFTKGAPTLVMVGDVYFKPEKDISAIEQLLKYYEKDETNIALVGRIEAAEIKNTGIIDGSWVDEEKTVIAVNNIVEKPTIEYAKENFEIDNDCYAQYGTWILNDEVLEKLEHNVQSNNSKDGKYELTDVLREQANKNNFKAINIKGRYYDLRTIQNYKEALLNIE